ncbi:MAG: RluA family pseudouridine synthase [Patescibacteria group bacterium]
MIKKIEAKSNEVGKRLDSFLVAKLPEFSRSQLSSLIKKDMVTVNKNSTKPSYKINSLDLIEINIAPRLKKEVVPEKINLDIIYEDENVIVVNKQPGIVVHPAAGNSSGTLVNALLDYFPKIREAVYEKGNIVSEQRPGLVHRLDKDTSGVIIIAKNERTMHSLSKQIQNRTVKKIYIALCCGWPKKSEGRLINYLGRHPKNRKMIADIGKEKGREAISDYKVLQCFEDSQHNRISLVEFNIKTGRTHQIRVQASLIGIPVLGDQFYGNKHCDNLSQKMGIERQLLHARTLEISLPGDVKHSTFEAPIPKDMESVLDNLKSI